MFSEKELEIIKVILSQVQFRAGQSEQVILVEQIIKKIVDQEKKAD